MGATAAAAAAAPASAASAASAAPALTGAPATPIPTVATPSQAALALAGVDTVLLDQDGVLWRADEDVPGAGRALASLARSGRRLFFVTNNSTLSRSAYAAKLSRRLGMSVEAAQVVCSAWSAAEYLRGQGFGGGGGSAAAAADQEQQQQQQREQGELGEQQQRPPDGEQGGGRTNNYHHSTNTNSKNRGKKVLAIGEEGLFEELRLAGIEAVRGPVFAAQTATTTASRAPSLPLTSLDCRASDVAAFEVDPAIGAVLVGWSASQFSYAWVAYAAACLREIPGCVFVTTNTDAADALPAGRLLPGTGMIVAALRGCAGCEAPVDAGKGGAWLLKGLLPRAVPGYDPARTAMVGDRLDTDVAFAVEGGMRAAFLTLTGVATRAQAERAGADRRPTHILPSLADLALEDDD